MPALSTAVTAAAQSDTIFEMKVRAKVLQVSRHNTVSTTIIRDLAVWCVCGVLVLAGPCRLDAQSASSTWSSARLLDATAWPHSERDVRLTATSRGLRVEVADERHFAIAAASQLTLLPSVGRLRVEVAEVAPGAKWFVRLYGDLRRPGEPRTASVAEGETKTGEWVIPLDPRLRQNLEAPVQLQLGVEGPPGAFAVFQDVAFLAPLPRVTARLGPSASRASWISRPWN